MPTIIDIDEPLAHLRHHTSMWEIVELLEAGGHHVAGASMREYIAVIDVLTDAVREHKTKLLMAQCDIEQLKLFGSTCAD